MKKIILVILGIVLFTSCSNKSYIDQLLDNGDYKFIEHHDVHNNVTNYITFVLDEKLQIWCEYYPSVSILNVLICEEVVDTKIIYSKNKILKNLNIKYDPIVEVMNFRDYYSYNIFWVVVVIMSSIIWYYSGKSDGKTKALNPKDDTN